jgi:hypothetical protein
MYVMYNVYFPISSFCFTRCGGCTRFSMFCYFSLSATSRRRSAAGRADLLCPYCAMPVTILCYLIILFYYFKFNFSYISVCGYMVLCHLYNIYVYANACVYICLLYLLYFGCR